MSIKDPISTAIPPQERNLFMDDPMNDALIATIINLTGELSVTRQRLSSLEIVLQNKGILQPTDIEAVTPSGPESMKRVFEEFGLIDRVMKVITEHVETQSKSK